MLLAHLTFRSKSRLSDHTIDVVDRMHRAWWEGGQVLGPFNSLVIRAKTVQTVVCIPERSALSPRHALSLTKNHLRELAKIKVHIETNVIGPVAGELAADSCHRPGPLLIFSTAYTDSPPVRCGRCFAPVPLYRLPPQPVKAPFFNTEYDDLLTWQRDFNAMDNLWFDSSFSEKHAFRQLSNPKSELNQDGLSLRESLEDRTGRKVYYFLFAHCDIKGGNLPPDRPCPICGGKWLQKREVFTRFTHKCEKCRIVTM